ncbi:hypothetical protein FGG79_14000 [Bacillus sp. BHET2]|uniref:hypothetical protein n=1 Tax=Bacillus sp. BHET2 TaxID=2583818 RepID=UPI00110ED214|nr:hypothetical protein [Bacillus sp. BHET2]TMU85008.1 hypothetical protein FGG79_14000 [Bacillus sp. BHET2]
MDRELQRQIRKMTDEGLQGFDFNNRMKDTVRNRVADEKPKREYRRRWYAPLISFMIILLFVFVFAVVKGEQWGFLGNEKLSGFFTNKSNFDVEIRYDGGMTISTFSDAIISEEGEKRELNFSKEEMNEIYTKLETMNFKEDKHLSNGEKCSIQPSQNFVMKIRMNRDTYEYRFVDCNTTADGRELDELRELIMSIIKRKSDYEDLIKQKLII